MKRGLRYSLKSQIKKRTEDRPRLFSIRRQNSQNVQAQGFEKLSFMDIQTITRSMLHDSKAHENNMGIISSIKGKMYCLKLGEVSTSKDFSRFFYSKLFRMKKKKGQPLKKTSSNFMHTNDVSYDPIHVKKGQESLMF